MTTVGMVLGSLCDMAPVERKMEFDNVGLLAGDAGQEVSRVLLCLDITMQAVEEARQQRCQLIVSHHPLFFSLPKALRCDCYETARVTCLLQYGISAICMHTNLDCAAGGVNDVLLQRLGLSAQGGLGEQALGRIGLCGQGMTAQAFARFVKQCLGCRVVRFVDGGRPVHRVAVVGGSGGDFVGEALEAGCDTLVTADVKHHEFLEAAERGLTLLDAGHYHTERPVLEAVRAFLEKRHPELTLVPSDTLVQDEVFAV